MTTSNPMLPRFRVAGVILIALIGDLSLTVAQDAPPTNGEPSLLVLPRMGGGGTAGGRSSAFLVDDLTIGNTDNARSISRQGFLMLAIDAGSSWARSLRGSADEVVFVSISAQCSVGTILNVGGAALGVTSSDVVGYAQLMIADDSPEGWRALDINLPLQQYEGKPMAAVPVLTFRLEPTNGVFDIYSGTRLVAGGLALDSKSDRRFTLNAGPDGAILNSLVQSDENPLYEDVNANGIDDRFEMTKRGQLLARSASTEDRQTLAKEWIEHTNTERPQAIFHIRPRPDRASAPSSR